jgi:O-antigen/teichoic acid export membrane protein
VPTDARAGVTAAVLGILPSDSRSHRGGVTGRARGVPIQRVLATLRDPMLRNGHALIISAASAQIIGVAFWVVAARSFPAATVGRNSAAISVTTFLAGVAELNLMSALVRFLPTSGNRSRRFILTIYAVSVAIAILLGAGFMLLVPQIEPQLDYLRSSPVMAAWFVLSVATGAIFVLQDSALTGVRAAPFVPVENIAFSLVKLAIMIPVMQLLPVAGIYVAWTLAFLLAVIPTNGYLFGRAIPRHIRGRPATGPPPRLRNIQSYVIPDSVAAMFFMASTSLLPLLIIRRAGAAAAAHYSLAWLMGYSLYLVSLNMGSSLIVETADNQDRLRARCVRALTHLGKLLIPIVIVTVVAAPYLLLVFGPGYARADAGALRLLALSSIPAMVTNLAVSVTRSKRRMKVVVGIQFSICALVWALSFVLVGPLGITGVGAAWLIAQSAVAAVLLVWPALWIPARRPPRHAASVTVTPAASPEPMRAGR